MRLFIIIIFLNSFLFSTGVRADEITYEHERDSLLKVLAANNLSDTSRVNTLLKLAYCYSTNYHTQDSARMLNELALDLSQEIDYKKGEGLVLLSNGRLANNNPFKAASYFKKARDIFKSIHYLEGEANTYMQDGVLMYSQNNFNEALPFFNKSLELYQEINDTFYIARMHHLIGISQSNLGDYKNALSNLQSALNIFNTLQEEQESIECRLGLADTYFKSGKLEDALIYYRMVYEYSTNTSSYDGITHSGIGIGNIYMSQKKIKEAEAIYLEAFELTKNYDSFWIKIKASNTLAEFYDKIGNPQKELYYLKIAKQSQDSLYNEKNMTAMARAKSEFDIAEHEREAAVLRLENKKKNEIQIYLIAILVLFLIVIYGMARRAYIKKILRNKLEEKNKELIESLVQLKLAEEQVIKSEKMAVFGKLSAGIAHEIRNPLNFITNFAELSQQMMDDCVHTENEKEKHEMAEQIKKLVDKIGYHGRRADNIITRMLQHSRSAHTDLEMTDLNHICNEFADLAYQSTRNMVTNFSCKLEKNLDPTIPRVWLVPQDISRVVINLLNNAFYAVHDKKHLQLNGYEPEVVITTSHDDKNVKITVHDNGEGIPQETQAKIFDPFFTTKPTGEGTGLGLSICADIVKAASGKISMYSTAEAGTTFEVMFPVETPIELTSS